jgi:hypothetical protein
MGQKISQIKQSDAPIDRSAVSRSSTESTLQSGVSREQKQKDMIYEIVRRRNALNMKRFYVDHTGKTFNSIHVNANTITITTSQDVKIISVSNASCFDINSEFACWLETPQSGEKIRVFDITAKITEINFATRPYLSGITNLFVSNDKIEVFTRTGSSIYGIVNGGTCGGGAKSRNIIVPCTHEKKEWYCTASSLTVFTDFPKEFYIVDNETVDSKMYILDAHISCNKNFVAVMGVKKYDTVNDDSLMTIKIYERSDTAVLRFWFKVESAQKVFMFNNGTVAVKDNKNNTYFYSIYGSDEPFHKVNEEFCICKNGEQIVFSSNPTKPEEIPFIPKLCIDNIKSKPKLIQVAHGGNCVVTVEDKKIVLWDHAHEPIRVFDITEENATCMFADENKVYVGFASGNVMCLKYFEERESTSLRGVSKDPIVKITRDAIVTATNVYVRNTELSFPTFDAIGDVYIHDDHTFYILTAYGYQKYANGVAEFVKRHDRYIMRDSERICLFNVTVDKDGNVISVAPSDPGPSREGKPLFPHLKFLHPEETELNSTIFSRACKDYPDQESYFNYDGTDFRGIYYYESKHHYVRHNDVSISCTANQKAVSSFHLIAVSIDKNGEWFYWPRFSRVVVERLKLRYEHNCPFVHLNIYDDKMRCYNVNFLHRDMIMPENY